VDDAIARTLSRITNLLTEIGIRYAVTGGIVSAKYGEARTTRDVDIVAAFSNALQIANLLATLTQNNYVFDADLARDAIRENRMFTALDMDTYFKIDFHIGEEIPGELARARNEELLPGILMPVLTAEDAIISKLIWIQKGSFRSRRDVVGILQRRQNLDWDYLNQTSQQMKVMELLSELKAEADS
jgi:hypothetical protein